MSEPVAASLLLANLLREQQIPTAVERFARHHHGAPGSTYRDPRPLGRPGPGQQYAFEVDLDACTGCKACVAACHSLNGLDEGELWRTVGLLHGGTSEEPAQRTVTTSCHHCVDPACLSGCPVRAYEKDPVTGIVRHLDDQCIGCQYCTLMCPYDAPEYSPSRGIVRKCDMSSDRLAVGEDPACVGGCPNQAIRIRVVDQIEVLQRAREDAFLAGAPTPDHTLPTTVYRSARPAVALVAADLHAVGPEHGHLPLVFVLVLTQLAVGALLAAALGRLLGAGEGWSRAEVVGALGVAVVAMTVSPLHLGRPLHAWRFFLGLPTSWLSREILALSLFAGALAADAASRFPERVPSLLAAGRSLWEGAAAVTGVALVGCSVMVYAATRRAHWRATLTAARFLGTTALLGVASALATTVFLHGAAVRLLALATMLLAAAKLAGEAAALRRGREHGTSRRIAALMTSALRGPTLGRFGCGAFGGLFLPALLLVAPAPPIAIVALASLLAGELGERFLFFKTAPPSRMPGALP